jgi:hypothetical protein
MICWQVATPMLRRTYYGRLVSCLLGKLSRQKFRGCFQSFPTLGSNLPKMAWSKAGKYAAPKESIWRPRSPKYPQ